MSFYSDCNVNGRFIQDFCSRPLTVEEMNSIRFFDGPRMNPWDLYENLVLARDSRDSDGKKIVIGGNLKMCEKNLTVLAQTCCINHQPRKKRLLDYVPSAKKAHQQKKPIDLKKEAVFSFENEAEHFYHPFITEFCASLLSLEQILKLQYAGWAFERPGSSDENSPNTVRRIYSEENSPHTLYDRLMRLKRGYMGELVSLKCLDVCEQNLATLAQILHY
jgi:hypothetical protein